MDFAKKGFETLEDMAKERSLNLKVLDFIRQLSFDKSLAAKDTSYKISKSLIKSTFNVTYTTVRKTIENLIKDDLLITDDKDEFRINTEFAYFLGIVIGTSHIKVSLVNFAFEYMDKNSINSIFEKHKVGRIFDDEGQMVFENKLTGKIEKYIFENELDEFGFCIKTPDNLDDTSKILIDVLEIFTTAAKNGFRLMSIGIAFPGAVDIENRKVVNCYNLSFLNAFCMRNILTKDIKEALELLNIDIFFEHNSKSAAIGEKFYLYKNDSQFKKSKNIITLFLSTGFSSALILDNKIFRGANNLSGEIGHLQMIDFPEKGKINESCTCGKDKCVELYVRNEIFEMTLDNYKNMDIKVLEEKLISSEEKKQKLAIVIAKLINDTSALINPDLVILTGKISRFYEYISVNIKNKLDEISLPFIKDNYNICTSSLCHYSPSVGAAISSYYQCLKEDIVWYDVK